MNWEFHTFQTLDTSKLFELMKLRTDVFVVEQQCAYPELDSYDNLATTIHLLAFDQHSLVAYARAMPMGDDSSKNDLAGDISGSDMTAEANRGTLAVEASRHNVAVALSASEVEVVRIGRVVVTQSRRGTGLAEQLMNRLINHLEEQYPAKDLILSAQEPIVSFYQALGFAEESDAYLEDGIPHIDMRRTSIPSSKS